MAELYATFGQRLPRAVHRTVQAPDHLIEDACQVAWSRLVRHRGRVRRDTAPSWLVTTAVNEALKLVRRSERELSLESEVEHGAQFPASRRDGIPQTLIEDRERLRSVRALPQDQQRLLWLYGVGLSYKEIARSQGCTSRAVERQLHSARATLRESFERA